MTEEEKKAIKVLEKYKFSEREEYLENNAKKIGKKYEDLYLERTWIPTTYERKQFTIVYNLIEKLQKENEELKNKVFKRDKELIRLEEYANKNFARKDDVKAKYIPKDKIREIIKELRKRYFEEDDYCWNGFIFKDCPSKVLNIKEDIKTEDLLEKFEELLKEE